MPAKKREPYALADTEFNLAKMEIATITQAFRRYHKAPIEAIANMLGIKESALWYKMRVYALNPNKLRTAQA